MKLFEYIFIVIILFLSLVSKTYGLENNINLQLKNATPGCEFLFKSYFPKFLNTKNNLKIFKLDKSISGVSYSKTEDLDLTAQITVKKGKAANSPTLTLFFALEKNKKIGNFIIPDARQKLCRGNFSIIDSQTIMVNKGISKSDLSKQNRKEPQIKIPNNIFKKTIEEGVAKTKDGTVQLLDQTVKKIIDEKGIKLIEEKRKRIEEEQKKIREKQKARRIAEEKKKIIEKQKAKKLAEAKAKKRAEQKAKKLAEAKAKKIAEQKAKKLAEAKAKKNAEEKIKKIKSKSRDYKLIAKDLYNDIDIFVKSGAEIDLLKLADFYSIRPELNKTWNLTDIKNFENLNNFMIKNKDFVEFQLNQNQKRQKLLNIKLQKINNFLDANKPLLKKIIRDNFGTKISKEGVNLLELIEKSNDINSMKKIKSNLENLLKIANVKPIYPDEKKKMVKSSETYEKQISEIKSEIKNNNTEASKETKMIEPKNNEKINQELEVKAEIENEDSGFFEIIFGSIIDFFAYIFNFIADIFGGIFNFIGYVFGGIFNFIADIFEGIFNFVTSIFTGDKSQTYVFNGSEMEKNLKKYTLSRGPMDEFSCAMTGLIFSKEVLMKIKANETPNINELKGTTPTTIEVFKDKIVWRDLDEETKINNNKIVLKGVKNSSIQFELITIDDNINLKFKEKKLTCLFPFKKVS